MIHRRDSFRAVPSTTEKVKKNKKIELITNSVVNEIKGDNSGVCEIVIKNKNGEIRNLKVPGIFTFIGLDVRNDILKDENGEFICEMNENGQVVVNLKMQTNVPGLFAAGDIRQDAPKQVVCSAGDGAIAALSAINYIENQH